MTGIIILAAGSSSRMGQAKQQLVYQEKTLLQLAIQAAIGVNDAKVLVVLGADHQTLMADVDSKLVSIVVNPDWEQGMASSIKAGMAALQELYPQIESALIMLCDQPFVDAALLQQLVNASVQNPDLIVASAYQNTVGVPVLLGKHWFDKLLTLQGQEGAKQLLMLHPDNVIAVPFEKGGIDIDTPQDYKSLLGN
jgi:molybdenum cofactor cytidylyltransferase